MRLRTYIFQLYIKKKKIFRLADSETKKKFWGRTNRLFLFDETPAEEKTTRATILLLVHVYSLPRERSNVEGYTQTHKQNDDLLSLLLFVSNRGSSLKCKLYELSLELLFI